jgi:hypothetical protein
MEIELISVYTEDFPLSNRSNETVSSDKIRRNSIILVDYASAVE